MNHVCPYWQLQLIVLIAILRERKLRCRQIACLWNLLSVVHRSAFPIEEWNIRRQIFQLFVTTACGITFVTQWPDKQQTSRCKVRFWIDLAGYVRKRITPATLSLNQKHNVLKVFRALLAWAWFSTLAHTLKMFVVVNYCFWYTCMIC